jgi:GNAT superfamily N-acetyltransferase
VANGRHVVRPAEPSEAEALTELCRASKAHWGYPEAWLKYWRDELAVTPEYIAGETVRVLEVEGQNAGFFALRRSELVSRGSDLREGATPDAASRDELAPTLVLEHLWLAPRMVGRGWGRVLFEAAVATARSRGARGLTIKADPNAESFYRKMGAERVGEEKYELPDGTPRTIPMLHYAM